jgi:uncharacterized protein (DUF302 family)
MNFYNSIIVKDKNFKELRQEIEAALKTEGFGILTEIDFQATMKNKLDKEILPHTILGACNPVYADKVVSLDPHVSTMLPCNVTMRQLENGDIEVASINPASAMGSIDNSAIEEYAKEINEKLNRVLAII